MQTYHVVATGFFPEVVKKELRQPAQHLGQFRQTLADIHHLLRQLAHRETVLGFLPGRHIEIKDSVQRGDQLIQLLTVAGQALGIGQRRRGFRPKLLHTGRHQLTEQIQL